MTTPNMQPSGVLGNLDEAMAMARTYLANCGVPVSELLPVQAAQPLSASKVDPAVAVAFLKQLDPTGWHLLTAIHPVSEVIVGRLFAPGSWNEVAKWVREHEAWNQYYHVNEPSPRASGPKALKSEIVAVRVIVGDKDPQGESTEAVRDSRAELLAQAERIAAGKAAPSYTIDSGNGVQLVYRLAAKLPAAEHGVWAEAQGRGLKVEVGGDAVQNLDRIMRLPGTMNWSTPKKLAAGRKGGPVRILHHRDVTFTQSELEGLWPPVAEGTTKEGSTADNHVAINALIDELDFNGAMAMAGPQDWPEGLAERIEEAKCADPALRALLRGDGGARPRDGGASDRRAKLAAMMGRLGFSAQDFCDVVVLWPLGEPTNADELTVRDVAREWARIGERAAAAHDPTTWFEPTAAEVDVSHFPRSAPGPSNAEGIAWINPAAWHGREPTEQLWFVDGVVPHGEVTLLTGRGGIGKSLLAQQLLTSVALGVPFLGRETEAARVMGFFCEDSDEVLHRRQKAICRSLGCEVDALSDVMRLASRKHSDNLLAVFHRSSPEMRPTKIFETLLADARAFGARVVVLDTIADTYAGDENNRQQVRQYVQACAGRLAAAIDGAVILLGHPSRAGENTGEGTSGSTAWHGSVRSRFYLEESGKAGSGFRKLTSMKSNYGPTGDSWVLTWCSGVLEVVSSSETTRGVDTTASDLDTLILAALRNACADLVRVSAATNSSYRAWQVLRGRDPAGFARFTDQEVKDALQGLMATGRIVNGTLGRGEDRHDIKSLIVVENAPSEGAGVFG